MKINPHTTLKCVAEYVGAKKMIGDPNFVISGLNEIHEVEGLKVGETYTLHETAAPEGYTIASDTTFTIDAQGNVTTTGSMTQEGVVLVKDAKTKVKVK